MRNRCLFALLTVLAAFFAAECQRSSVQSTGDAQPVREVLAAGRAPVEMGAVTPMLVSAGAPTFSVKVRNVTDAPLDSILWTVVPFDRAGNIIPDGEEEGGYADPLNPIGPGESPRASWCARCRRAKARRASSASWSHPLKPPASSWC